MYVVVSSNWGPLTVYIYIYIYIHIIVIHVVQRDNCDRDSRGGRRVGLLSSTPSPPTRSFDFTGFDVSKLLILKGGHSHVRGLL